MTAADRTDLARAAAEEWGEPVEHCVFDYSDLARFLLIQGNELGERWFSTHDSPEDAATYCDNEEVPWQVDALVDLDTGTEYEHRVTTTFYVVTT